MTYGSEKAMDWWKIPEIWAANKCLSDGVKSYISKTFSPSDYRALNDKILDFDPERMGRQFFFFFFKTAPFA